jgi:hypothetical protein
MPLPRAPAQSCTVQSDGAGYPSHEPQQRANQCQGNSSVDEPIQPLTSDHPESDADSQGDAKLRGYGKRLRRRQAWPRGSPIRSCGHLTGGSGVSTWCGPQHARRIIGVHCVALRQPLGHEVGIGGLGTLPFWPALSGTPSLRKPWSSSSGSGNTIVLFFSAAISVSVCR